VIERLVPARFSVAFMLFQPSALNFSVQHSLYRNSSVVGDIFID
jgi:hypothetical protein